VCVICKQNVQFIFVHVFACHMSKTYKILSKRLIACTLLTLVCVVDKEFASSNIWHARTFTTTQKNLNKQRRSTDTHDLKIWHIVWFIKEQNYVWIDTLEIEIRRTTRYVTLRWHFTRTCWCQSTFIFVFENVTWHFGFEVEHPMRFVKHTNYLTCYRNALMYFGCTPSQGLANLHLV
jgi:hypothetical protein